jgi:cobalt/nickel transport system permease protein
MHVPDGFINAPVSVAAGAAAAAAVAVSLRGARRELGGAAGESAGSAAGGGAGNAPVGGERTAPLAGLVAAFIFAVQMLNFPVAAGTSGHLLGGALAAILVGPYTGVLCVSVVLLMQGVLFADGGLTALGVNILDMGVVTVLVAYGIFRALLRVLPRGRGAVTGASFAAALVSVPAAAIAFTGIYAAGGTADVALGRVFAAMTGVHVLIGIGEAVITAATVGAVVAVRPDLVHGARDFAARPLELRTAVVAAPGGGTVPKQGEPAADGAIGAKPAPATASAPAALSRPSRRPTRGLWLGGLAATVICAGFVSFYASASPDGLEKIAADHGIDKKAEDHAAKESPLADYGVESIADARLSGGLAGVIGAGATLAVGSGVFVAVRRRRDGDSADSAPGAGTSGGTQPSAPSAPSGREAV